MKRTYFARSADELKKFDEIVKKAMGYNEDREDQVTVSSISFADSSTGLEELPAEAESSKLGILKQVLGYKKTIINLLLAAILFVLVIRPLMKSMKNLAEDISIKTAQLSRDTGGEHEQIVETSARGQMERAMQISRENDEKAQQLIKGWIGENE